MKKLSVGFLISFSLVFSGCSTIEPSNSQRSIASDQFPVWEKLEGNQLEQVEACYTSFTDLVKNSPNTLGGKALFVSASGLALASGAMSAVMGPAAATQSLVIGAEMAAFYGLMPFMVGIYALPSYLVSESKQDAERLRLNFLNLKEFVSFVKEQQNGRPGLMTELLLRRITDRYAAADEDDYTKLIFKRLNKVAQAGKCSIYQFEKSNNGWKREI